MRHQHSKFLLLQAILLLLSLLILLNFFSVAGRLDLHLIQPFIDAHAEFPLRQNWALAELNHRYVKYILIAVYLSYLLAWLLSFRFQKLRARRWKFGYFFWMAVISTSVIAILKSQSAHACPWDMSIATAHGVWWDLSATAGHCFPGGHASSGFALLVGYFVYRVAQPKRAYFFLIAACILGMGMGSAQMMRGAHFFSHNLWTGWITWCLNVVAYAFLAHKLPQSKSKLKPDLNASEI